MTNFLSVMALACNTFSARTFEVALSLVLMTIGALVLMRAIQGRLRRNRISGVTDANLGCGVVSAGLILLGFAVLVSALLRLDC